MAGLIGLIILFGAGIFANYIAPYSYRADRPEQHPPRADADGNHFFGTDEIGRDEFSRVIWGIRTSLEVGVFVAVLSTIIGLVHRRDRRLLRRLGRQPADALHRPRAHAAVPRHPAHRGGPARAREASGASRSSSRCCSGRERRASSEASSCRCARRSTSRRRRPPAQAMLRIMFRHILPNTLGPVVVAMTLAVATAILIEAALSFLGFGIKPPTPSLGVLVAERPDEPAAVVAHHLPGLDHRPDRALRELRRRRPARCARPDPAESPCLTRFCRSRTWRSSSRRTTASSTRWTTSPTTSSRARRSGSSASPDRARASAPCPSSD